MTQLTFTEAATHAGVSRQTIYKYVSKGLLSATISRDGKKQIDITELLRVFGHLHSPSDKPSDKADTRRMSAMTPATDVILELERAKMQIQARDTELALLRERVEELKAREQEAKDQARDALEQQNRLMGIVEMQGRLLAAPEKAVKAEVAQSKKKAAKGAKKA